MKARAAIIEPSVCLVNVMTVPHDSTCVCARSAAHAPAPREVLTIRVYPRPHPRDFAWRSSCRGELRRNSVADDKPPATYEPSAFAEAFIPVYVWRPREPRGHEGRIRQLVNKGNGGGVLRLRHVG